MDETLRLLHVVPTYLPAVRYGGPIRSVHALCRALAANGNEVHAFTTSVDGPFDSDVPLGRPVDVDGVKVTYFPSRYLRRLYWSPAMGRALSSSVADFDIVHVHAMFLWPTWASARAARRNKVPYVLSPRGMLVPELIRRKSRLVKSAWIALIDRTNVELAAAIHATSEVEASHLSAFGWKLPQVAVIPHGVDDPMAEPDQAITPDVALAIGQAATVLALGRISWEKALDRLVAAMPLVPEAHLVIAGNDADGQAAHLAQVAASLGVAGRVTIIARHVEGADKEALFAAAKLFAMTSLSENFGLAALEAMRRGLPVLSTPGVGMADIVRETGAGLVVDPSPQAVADGMRRLLGEPDAARRMGETGRTHVTTHYGWQSVAVRMEALYRSLVAAPARETVPTA
jgi:glycosyltransferase involved in cell wall biosynthesis